MMKYNGNINDITKMIKHIMIDNDIRQKDLCNATGWTKSTISNLLNNRTENPSLKLLLELCEAINCDLIIDIKPKEKWYNKGIDYPKKEINWKYWHWSW